MTDTGARPDSATVTLLVRRIQDWVGCDATRVQALGALSFADEQWVGSIPDGVVEAALGHFESDREPKAGFDWLPPEPVMHADVPREEWEQR